MGDDLHSHQPRGISTVVSTTGRDEPRWTNEGKHPDGREGIWKETGNASLTPHGKECVGGSGAEGQSAAASSVGNTSRLNAGGTQTPQSGKE